MANAYLDAYRASGTKTAVSGGTTSSGSDNPYLSSYRTTQLPGVMDTFNKQKATQKLQAQQEADKKKKAEEPNWFQKGIEGVVKGFTTGARIGEVLNAGKETFVDPAAKFVQQANMANQIQSKNAGTPIVGDNFAKNQNAEIDRALKAGDINQKRANELRAKTTTAVTTTKQSVQAAEKNVGVKYNRDEGIANLIDAGLNLGGLGLGEVAKTVFTKVAETATKNLGRKLTADEAKNLAEQTKKAVPEPHASEAGSIAVPTKAEPDVKSTAKVSSLTPEAQKGADKMQLDYLNEKAKTNVLTTGEKAQRDELKAKAVEITPTPEPHPMQEPIFTAAKTQAEKRLGRELTPAETTKLTNDTQNLVQEKFPVEPTPVTEKVPVETPVTAPKPVGDTTSGNAARIEAAALEKKLTDKMGDLPQYKSINMKEQATQAIDLVKNDRQKAVDIINGKANPPDGLHPQSVHQALEDVAVREGNGELLTQLAKSHINTELSEGAQRLRIAAERDPHSAVEHIRQINERLQARADKRLKKSGTTVEKETKKAVSEVKKTTRVTSKKDLHDFIKKLEC